MVNKTAERTEKDRTKLWYNVAKRIAMVAGVLAAILSVLMIINYIQIKTVDPLNSEALVQLRTQLRENPENTALQEQIQALDLLARKAYFTNQWQIRTGSYLLFASVLVILLAMKYMSSLEPQLPDLNKDPESDESWETRFLSRKYILYGGLGLFLLAFVLGISSVSELENLGTPDSEDSQMAAVYPSLEELRDNWPGFRGPEGLGVAYHTDVPTEWDGTSGQNILWKTPIPLPGYNSPIVWGNRIFMSGADETSQVVYCFDTETGEILWQTELNNIPGSPAERPRVTEDTGYAAPTMTTDGQRVFVLYATGDIACLDFNGNRIWAKNLGTPDNPYGHASSLITYQDLLLVQYDSNNGGRLLALKTVSGDIVYDQPRDVEISWASPILVNPGSQPEIILNSSPSVMAYDPRTGQELWKVDCMYGEIGPSPAYTDNMVYVASEFASLVALTPRDTTPEITWQYFNDLPPVSSPLATQDLVFIGASYGTVTCLDSKTGEMYWFHDFDRGFYSSPILVGDSVYIMDVMGTTHIIKADKEFQLVNSNELGERVVTIPAFTQNRIYVRGESNLFCIGE